MSLVRGLTTTGKKRGKVKFASAEAKRRSMELDAEWQQLKSRWGVSNTKSKTVAVELPTVAKPHIRTQNDSKPTSLNSWVVGAAAKKDSKQYTGDKMVGIGTMHKSNTVPVFSDQEAKDIATMRRN
jgi:hypothetical protein